MIATDIVTPAKLKVRVPAKGRALASHGSSSGLGRTSYSGASRSDTNIALWRPSLKSADSDLLRDAEMVRARARDLRRNFPFAQQAVRASRLGVIGKKVRYSCRPDYRYLGIDFEDAMRWGQEFERVWETYAHGEGFGPDAGRRMTFTQLMGLAHDTDFTDGEVLGTFEWDESRRFRTCLQLVDVDRLSNPFGAPETARLKAGIQLNDLSAPVGYHIRDAHPGDYGLVGLGHLNWSFVRRYTDWGRPIVAHTFEHERPGQTRGISAFASVITAMKQGAEYTDVALQAEILRASYAAVLTSQQNYKDALEVIAGQDPTKVAGIVELAEENLVAAMEYHERIKVRFQGAQIPILWPGEDLKIVSPGNGASQLGDFQGHSTKSYAAGLGVNPVEVSQDYSNVNYSSAKMAGATAFRHYEWRRQRLIDGLAMPLVGAFLEEIVHSGAMPLPKGIRPSDFYAAKGALIAGVFLTQGAPNLDPVKESQADMVRLQIGSTTLQDIAAEEGKDYLDILDQQAREQNERMARGLAPPMLAGDPAALAGTAEDEPPTDSKPGKADGQG